MGRPYADLAEEKKTPGDELRRLAPARVFSHTADVPPVSGAEPLPRGRVVECRLDESEEEPDYFAYAPSRIDPSAPLLVSVHGINRDVIGHVELFIEVADRHGAVVVAPYFDADRFPGYQRLSAKGRRADKTLEAVVADVRRRARLKIKPFTMFGYSGGAQFAHRYALTQPRHVRTLILAAAGWYTLPARRVRYPYGTEKGPRYPHVRCRVRSFLRIPTRVVVGADDTDVDPAVNQDAFVTRRLGRHRVQRAERWVEAVRRACARRDFAPAITLTLLPGVGHSFRDCVERGLDRIVSDSL